MATILHLCSSKALPSGRPTTRPSKRLHSVPSAVAIPAPRPPPNLSARHTTLLVDAFHQNQSLRALLRKLEARHSDPLHIIKDDGDWSRQHFWAVIKYLSETSRFNELRQVFDHWRNMEKSRTNEVNYGKVIDLLSSAGLMNEAVLAFREMIGHGLSPSVETYNCIIHGFAKRGEFDEAKSYLNMMEETGAFPDSETYDGLIQAYADFKMFDEMCKCMKKMEAEGCSADHVTYNILIRAFARGGLLGKMEGMYQSLLSKKMSLQPATLTAMFEAYADFGFVGKLERFYRKIINSKVHFKDYLVRKMARVYIENYRFSGLEKLGLETAFRTGRSNLVWYLLLLSNACLLSQNGMESVIQEMRIANFKLDVTCMNIVGLAYMKMKDTRHLDIWLTRFQSNKIRPDIVSVGIVYDAQTSNLCRKKLLHVWQTIGLLNEEAKLNTDPLVLIAFGKGFFLRSCEDLYSALDAKAREKKLWTYDDLIKLVSCGRRKPAVHEHYRP